LLLLLLLLLLLPQELPMRVEFMSEVGTVNTLILKYLDRCGLRSNCYITCHVTSCFTSDASCFKEHGCRTHVQT
jgi:hypothetical protein